MSVGVVDKTTGDPIPTAGMPAVDSVLSGTSTNPVQNRVVKAALDDITDGQSIDSFADVETALALKQDKTDNSLDTEAKTIVGAINEHEGDIDSLKNGLTNLDNEVNGDAVEYPYADVITISDAIPSNLADCNVKIEPDQDLHGQSAPYVGGAGKNKLPLVLADIKTANTDGTWNGNAYTIGLAVFTVNCDTAGNVVSITATNSSDSTQRYIELPFRLKAGSYIMTSGFSESQTYIDTLLSDGTSVIARGGLVGSTFTLNEDTDVTWNFRIVNSSNTVTCTPMIRLSTETDATFAPYTNICPITGHTEASVQRDGKNLWNKNIDTSGYIDSNGAIVSAENWCYDYIKISGGDKITISGAATNTSAKQVWYDANKQPIEVFSNHTNGTFTAPNNAVYVGICARKSGQNADNDTLQVELGSSATDYEPFKGKTYTIALGDTIYGGTVRIDSNGNTVMDVDRAVVDLGTLNYTYNATDKWYKSPISNMKLGAVRTLTMLCECYQCIDDGRPFAEVPDSAVWNGDNSGEVYIRDTRYTDPSDLATALDGIKLVYPIATQFTVQLTPTQIQLLKGTNTLTASTGQISVTANGVSGSIGSVQEQVNELADSVVDRFDNVIGWDKRENLFEPIMLQNYSFSNVTVTVIKDDLGRVTTYRTNTATAGSGRVNVNLCGFVAPKTGTYYIKGVKLNGWSLYNTKMYLYDKTVGADAVESIGQNNTVVTNLTKDHLYLLCLSIMGGSSITATDIKPVVSMIDGVSDKPITPLIGYNVNELMTRLPKAPTTDGTYNLQATVASGTPTYSWVSTT